VIIWIDKKTGVLVKHEYYKQNKFHKSVTLYGIKINAGLKDKDFDI
jgi:outer membrane lipoprotein-sorting protein